MRRSAVLLGIVLVALLGAMAATPLLVQPPRLRSINHPGQFDARRAKARLAFVLDEEQSHPSDSSADDRVRARLVATLRQMGMQPVVRDQLACNELFKERGISCARVRNVIATIGPSRGKALLINSHYDSVAVGPGASDDGMGVATMLEVGSILKGRPLRRPVILLFNEGEELGLVGARAFLADPLGVNVDSLVNLEARGVTGPVNMFETSRPNASAVDIFEAAVTRPVANSLATDVYRLMPNYTDVNSFSERRWLTLNLAPIGNETRYHSPGDDLVALDPATLQHMGDQTLALAEALAAGVPPSTQSNRVFMDLSGRFLVSLPILVGVILLFVELLAFVAMSRERRGLVRSSAVVLGTMAGSAIVALGALALIGALRHGMFWRAQPAWAHLATFASVLLVACLLLATVGRGISRPQLRSAFWLLFLCTGAVIGLAAPGGIVFFLFPPLLAGLGMAAGRWRKAAEAAGSAAAILFLYVSWGAMLGLLEELLNGGPLWVFAPLATLLLLPALIEAKPLIDGCGTRAAGGLAAILMLAGWAAAAAAPAYSADREQRFVIQHVTDAAEGKAWWSVLDDGAPLPRAFGTGWKRGRLPLGKARRWISSAPVIPGTRAPGMKLLSQVRNGNERTLLVRLSANGSDDIEIVAPEDSRIRSAGVSGFVRPIDQGESGKYYIGCSGRSCEGVTLELTTAHMDPIHFLLVGSSSRLPAAAAPLVAARPRLARPQYDPDARIVFGRVNL